MSVHKREIIKQTAQKLNLSERATTEVVQTFLNTFVETLVKEGRLELRGLGVFEIKQRKSKKVRNIATGELIETKAYKDVEYKTSKTIKEKLNKPKRKLKKKGGKHDK
jgi:nucleoid DNA-binding protein